MKTKRVLLVIGAISTLCSMSLPVSAQAACTAYLDGKSLGQIDTQANLKTNGEYEISTESVRFDVIGSDTFGISILPNSGWVGGLNMIAGAPATDLQNGHLKGPLVVSANIFVPRIALFIRPPKLLLNGTIYSPG